MLINGQKTYGKEYSIRDTLAYYRMKLEGRFSVNQVLHAIEIYTDKKNDVPAPADLIGILSPESPKVTEAQYVQACKWQEANGWPMFSEAQDLIDDYRAQNAEEKDKYKTAVIENDKVKSLVQNSLKRITN